MTSHKKPIVLRRPDDFHVHLRQDDVLQAALPETARVFARALLMPNTRPPIESSAHVESYRATVADAAAEWPHFQPLMTFKISERSTAFWDTRQLRQARTDGLLAAKYYPEGATTNSEDGVSDVRDIWRLLEMLQEADIVLAIHGEDPSVFCLERELAFLPVLQRIAHEFPRLRIVLEHVSSKEGVDAVLALPDTVAATVTLHHLLLTLDDVVGGLLAPHHFCKPVVKSPADRDALRAVVFSGNPKFFFGSDSAPHLKEAKESAHGSAGIFTAPVLMPALAELFTEFDYAEKLEGFVSSFGADFYRLSRNHDQIELIHKPSTVPAEIAGVVPFFAGKELSWSLDQ